MKTIELTTNQRRTLEGKHPLNKSYIARHWRGDLSLARSYWLNGIVLSAVAVIALRIVLESIRTANKEARLIVALAVLIAFYVLCVWQFVGIWRSATPRYSLWGTLAKFCVILGWLFLFVSLLSLFADLLQLL